MKLLILSKFYSIKINNELEECLYTLPLLSAEESLMNQKLNRRHIIQGTALALGLAASSPIILAVSAYSKSAETHEKLNKKSFLNTLERKMINILAELIIPETSTPGAAAAGVPEFIDMMVSDWYTDEDKKEFIYGLRNMDHHCKTSFNNGFLDCTADQQIVTLEDLEQNVAGTISDGKRGGESGRVSVLHNDYALWGNRPLEGRDFFDQLKSLTILGYYTSEVGVKNELIYDPIPGTYDGSVDFSKFGKHYTS